MSETSVVEASEVRFHALPTVSVVIPCYRYGRFLPACVDSILEQDGVDVQVLIIDDASGDGSADVARQLAAESDRVEVRVHPTNHGHIATYNEGLLEWAEGDYSVLISADDLLTPGALARATRVLDDNPNAGFVYGSVVRWDGTEPHPAAQTKVTGVTLFGGQDWIRRLCARGSNVITAPEVMVRTSLQKLVGGYSPELPHTGDMEMWMRLAAYGDVAFIKGANQAYYRQHRAQMTTERLPLIDLKQRKMAFDVFFASHADQIPGASGLRARADRRLAKQALWDACRHQSNEAVPAVIDELVEFAFSTYAAADRLSEYWGLRWRRRAGPKLSSYIHPVMPSRVQRRVRNDLRRRRLHRRGY